MKRYLLDLSELFADHRRKAYIGYRPAWTTVASVICSIRSTFNIQSDLYICSEDGIYYPEAEQVGIICDEKVIKVFCKDHAAEKEKIQSANEPRKRRISNILQGSSTFEDIEATLLSLPKPKRRRVRKRKANQDTTEEPAPRQSLPRPQEKVQKAVSDTERNGHVRFSNEETQSSESSKSSEELELPYRNLNRTMKARVVRAVSPSALIDRSAPNESNGSDPSATASTAAYEPTNSEQTQPVTKLNIKARIVRATNGTVEVKQEQLDEASATEQSYQPPTAVEDTDVIEVDAPTHVNGEEDTHGETSATPAV